MAGRVGGASAVNDVNRHRPGWTKAMALVAPVIAIVASAMAACGTTALQSSPSTRGVAANCPAKSPALEEPLAGTRPPVLPSGAITAAICQYAPPFAARKAASSPLRRLVLRGEAADGLRAVLAGTDPITQQAARCDRAAALLPFEQVIYFGYRGSRTKASAVVTFTNCALAVVAAAGRFGLLPSPVQDDLFGYTLITAHDRGPLVTNVIGLAAARAYSAAARHHFGLTVDAQVVDAAVQPGTVIFQVLPPAVPDAGPSPHALGAIVAVRVAPACQASQLRLTYRAGGVGAGSDFGQVMFRDVAGAPCRLAGQVQLTGVGPAGQHVTNTVTASIAGPGVLGAVTAPVRDLASPPPDAMVYAWSIVAEYRDDATSPDGLCAEHVIPRDWRVQLPGGSTIVIPNADSGSPFRLLGSSGGLVTCRGRLSAMSNATFAG